MKGERREMALQNMIQEYEQLLTRKDELAEETKAVNASIEEAKQAIADQMVEDDTPQISIGSYSYSLQNKTKWSKKSEAKLMEEGLDFFEVLREQGLGDLIKETVNARSLDATLNDMAESEEGVPDELLDVVSRYDMLDIRRAKVRNSAVSRAKKGGAR